MYLGQKGVATILIGAHQGLDRRPDDDAGRRQLPRRRGDPAALLREQGEVRQAISVVKKRGSRHERTLREFRLDGGRIVIGEPLRDFRGVLTGVPVYEGREIRRPAKAARDRLTSPATGGCCSSPRRPGTAATTEAMLSPLGIGVRDLPRRSTS